MAALTFDLMQYSGPTLVGYMVPHIITGAGNFTLDFKQLDS